MANRCFRIIFFQKEKLLEREWIKCFKGLKFKEHVSFFLLSKPGRNSYAFLIEITLNCTVVEGAVCIGCI